jgi:amino-acid N-acetyltransferase
MTPLKRHQRLSIRITASAVILVVVFLSDSFRSTVGFLPSPSFRYRPFQVSIPLASTSKDLQDQETASSGGDATSIPMKSPLDEFDAQMSFTNSSSEDHSQLDHCISDNLSIDPASIVFEHFSDESVNGDYGFVKMFRGSANYIANHRSTTAVYHIPGGLLEKPEKFRDLMNDIALTWLLGMKIVLVAGCRHQIDKRVPNRTAVNGIYVTDKETLRVIKEEAGYVRFEVERQLARALRTHGTEMDGNVVSGNFFSAQPFGILDGVDYKFSGFVRRVEVDKIRRLHQTRDVCLLTTLGVSPSGEVFNVNSESLAATVAGALGASKIIFFLEQQVRLKNKEFGNQVMSLRHSDASNLLQHHSIEIQKRGAVLVSRNAPSDDRGVEDMLIRIGWATSALDQGVKRAHLLAPTQGALLQELYTRDGSGTLVSRDIYEGIRRANVNDVVGIHELISPLIKMGTLVDRPKAVLEKDIENYYVYTRDNLVVACGQLKPFEDGFAEIGCLVVRSEYRSGGRGDSMLGYLERLCLRLGATKVFVLSTQTMEWFIERDFQQVEVDKLPPSRQATYNHERGSKIYMKLIDSDRELDASELWWNR